jgi:hypothetical protein
MDHFRHSMAVREQILAEKPLMKKLAGHFLEHRKLEEAIGNGTNNIHYRAGVLPGGLWVATREQFQEPIPYGDPARCDPVRARFRETGNWKTIEFDIFCKEAYCWADSFGMSRSVSEFMETQGAGYVTSFSILVKYQPAWRERPLYALLVEDLTAGGAFTLDKPAERDWVARLNGTYKTVQIDLDDFPRWRASHPSVPDYTAEQAIIDLNKV